MEDKAVMVKPLLKLCKKKRGKKSRSNSEKGQLDIQLLKEKLIAEFSTKYPIQLLLVL
jgi:hypothetical protein